MKAVPVFDNTLISAVIDVYVNHPEVEDLNGIEHTDKFWFCLAPSDEWSTLIVLNDNWYYVTDISKDSDTVTRNPDSYRVWHLVEENNNA